MAVLSSGQSKKNSFAFLREGDVGQREENAYKQKASNFQHVLVCLPSRCLLFCLAKDRMLFKLILMFVALLWRWYWSCLWLYWEREIEVVSCPSASHRANILPGKNGDIQQLPPSRLCLQNPLIRQNKSVSCRLPLALMTALFLRDIYMKTSLFLVSLFFFWGLPLWK